MRCHVFTAWLGCHVSNCSRYNATRQLLILGERSGIYLEPVSTTSLSITTCNSCLPNRLDKLGIFIPQLRVLLLEHLPITIAMLNKLILYDVDHPPLLSFWLVLWRLVDRVPQFKRTCQAEAHIPLLPVPKGIIKGWGLRNAGCYKMSMMLAPCWQWRQAQWSSVRSRWRSTLWRAGLCFRSTRSERIWMWGIRYAWKTS